MIFLNGRFLEAYIGVWKQLYMNVSKQLYMVVSKRLPMGVFNRLHMGVSRGKNRVFSFKNGCFFSVIYMRVKTALIWISETGVHFFRGIYGV